MVRNTEIFIVELAPIDAVSTRPAMTAHLSSELARLQHFKQGFLGESTLVVHGKRRDRYKILAQLLASPIAPLKVSACTAESRQADANRIFNIRCYCG